MMYVLRKKYIVRPIAVLLLVLFTTNIFAPTAAYALSGGPVSTDFASFEPVDATDMVNLATGDFSYTLPLLEIPGPEGGYPLALSYHAGISPEEEASWVGLGWNLNPGAINRYVSGFPDDHNGAVRSVVDQWNGGETNSLTVGLGIGPVYVGLDFASDTYRGFGLGVSMGLGYGMAHVAVSSDPFTGQGSLSAGLGYGLGPFNANIGINTNASGQGSLYAAVGAGREMGPVSAYGSVGIISDLNFNNVSAYADLNANALFLGASMSSESSKPSLSVGGAQINTANNNYGQISTSSYSVGITIPIGIFTINLGYSYQRYWSHTTDNVNTYGALQFTAPFAGFPNLSMDAYTLNDPARPYDESPEKQGAGTLPAFDNYIVSAQGLGGNIQPYIYSYYHMFKQAVTCDADQGRAAILYTGGTAHPDIPNNRVTFRFMNDFSNYLVKKPVVYPEDPKLQGNFNAEYLPGSRHVEWFTNADIVNLSAQLKGFVADPNYPAANSYSYDQSTYDVSQQIGGFMITNESGVTYHYAIPVYAYNEYKRTESGDGTIYNEQKNYHPYAYTWLLTAITGPDFVDRQNDGITSDDYGYWVKFNYGQWTQRYGWRNPNTGWLQDIDSKYKTYARGFKEIYYLDAITTRTHTALFVKDIRNDAKSIQSEDLGEGASYYPYAQKMCDQLNRGLQSYDTKYGFKSGDLNYYNYPTSSLQLKSIYLVENTTLKNMLEVTLEKSGDGYDFSANTLKQNQKLSRPESFSYDCICEKLNGGKGGGGIPGTAKSITQVEKFHSWKNILDIDDLSSYHGYRDVRGLIDQLGSLGKMVRLGVPDEGGIPNPTLKDYLNVNALRRIDFNTDYTLCNNTSNSYVSDPYYVKVPSTDAGSNIKTGKLTLNSISFYGQGSIWVIPPVTFGYIKNPDYKEKALDIWRMYKSDYDKDNLSGNKNIDEAVTIESSGNIDSWSLTSIADPLGSILTIDYESDRYEKTAFDSYLYVPISSFQVITPTEVEFTLQNLRADQVQSLKPGTKILLNMIVGDIMFMYTDANNSYLLLNKSGDKAYINNSYSFKKLVSGTYVIDQVYDNKFTVSSPSSDLYYNITRYPGGNVCLNNTFNTSDGSSIEVCYNQISWDNSLVNGFISLAANFNPDETVGGGLRVANITYYAPLSMIEKETKYNYSGGVTSYEPFYLGDFMNKEDMNKNFLYTVYEPVQRAYNNKLSRAFQNVIRLSRDIPSPGITYQNVIVSNKITGKDGTVISHPVKDYYEFSVCQGDKDASGADNPYKVVDYAKTVKNFYPNYDPDEIVIHDFSTQIGNLKKYIRFNDANGDNKVDANEKLVESSNYYLHEYNPNAATPEINSNTDFATALAANYSNQGLMTQVCWEEKWIYNDYCGPSTTDIKILTEKATYPNVLVHTESKNYQTNVSQSTDYLQFDMYSGTATRSRYKDAYNNTYIKETVPAYTVYPQMGPKGMNADYKNMLSQSVADYLYKVNSSDNTLKTGLVSAGIQTWGAFTGAVRDGDGTPNDYGQDNIWRKKANYTWKGSGKTQVDGTYGLGTGTDFSTFNYWDGTGVPSTWLKTNENTLFNVNSHLLESADVNGKRSASLMDPEMRFVIAAASPAKYDQIAYSGAEYYQGNLDIEGNVDRGNAANVGISGAYAHTGKYSLLVAQGYDGFNTTLRLSAADASKKFIASVWAYLPGEAEDKINRAQLYYKIGDALQQVVSPKVTKKAQNWYLIEMEIDPQGYANTDIYIACRNQLSVNRRPIYFDDFRVYPKGAGFVSYVYDPVAGQLTHILDQDNFYTRYEYDAAGRLTGTYQEILYYAEKKVSETKYNFKQ